MEDLVIITTTLAVLTGLGALFCGWKYGDWKNLRLEFAGVVLALLGGVWLLMLIFFAGYLEDSCREGQMLCFARLTYTLVRNAAFTCFHISSAHHAIAAKRLANG